MPKTNKSSASAGTRKKHATKKAQKEHGDDLNHPSQTEPSQDRKQKDGKKLSRAQRKALPKIKQFVPPPKPPAPPILDPLDGQGLARTLPAELVVVLRRLGKKDDITRRKGLDELKYEWVKEVLTPKEKEEDEVNREIKEISLLSAIPCWFHNLASLLQSPSHRFAALQIQGGLLSIPALRSSILETMNLGLLPGTQNRDILGSWLVAALEEGRRPRSSGFKEWEASTVWSPVGQGSTTISERIDLTPQLPTLIEYLSLSILGPAALHDSIHPAPVSSAPASQAPIPKKGADKGGRGRAPIPSSRATVAPSPTLEDEEIVEERLTRYRIGGLVGLTWLLEQLPKIGIFTPTDELLALLRNPSLWLSLSPEFIDRSDLPHALGTAQPPVRRAAYSLLSMLMDSYSDIMTESQFFRMISDAVLGSCWRDRENVVWEAAGPAVVKFLSKFPGCWKVTVETVARSVSESDTDDSDGGDDDDEPNDADSAYHTACLEEINPHYFMFLEFLSTICPFIPHLTYPIIIIVISTLPPSILPLTEPSMQLQNLFSHLWAPVDARLLSTHSLPGYKSAFQSFFQCLLSCTTFLIGKSMKAKDGEEKAIWLAQEQLAVRSWKEGVLMNGGRTSGRSKACTHEEAIEPEAAMFGAALGKIPSMDGQLFEKAADTANQTLLDFVFPKISEQNDAPATGILPRILPILTALRNATEVQEVHQLSQIMLVNIILRCVETLKISHDVQHPSPIAIAETLIEAFRQYPQLVNEDIKKEIRNQYQNSAETLLATLSPSLFVVLLDLICSNSSTPDQFACQEIICSILRNPNIETTQRFSVANSLLFLDNTTLLREDSLDSIVMEAAQAALSESSMVAKSVVTASLYSLTYISKSALSEVLALACAVIHESIEKLLTTDFIDLAIPGVAFDIFTAYAEDNLADVVESDLLVQSIIAIHHIIFMLPRLPGHIATQEAKVDSLTKVWVEMGNLNAAAQQKVLNRVYEALKDDIRKTEVQVGPDVIIDVALATTIGTSPALQAKALAQILLPPTYELLNDLASHASRAPHPSLPIVDSLIPYIAVNDNSVPSASFDVFGRSKAAREAEAAVTLLRADRSLAEYEPSLLQAALTMSQIAQDTLAVPTSSRGLYSQRISANYLTRLIREVEGAMSFALRYVDEVPPSWHTDTVQALTCGSLSANSDLLQRLLLALKDQVIASGNDVSARSFRDLLSRHLRQVGVGEKECEVWLSFAMSHIDQALSLSLAIISAIKPFLLDTQPFITIQNRLASTLTSIPSSKCHTTLGLLRVFNASAPPADSASVFLPQQRALFVLRHIAGWLTSDDVHEEELPEDMECRVLEMEGIIAPIVQTVSGSHWNGIFDLIESGLENSALDDPASLYLLYHSLVVLQQIRDLCQTNKSLRASWTSKNAHMKLVLDMFLQCKLVDTLPLQHIQALILDLLPDIPDKIIERASLSSLCTLISFSTSIPIQTAAYRVLYRVIKHQTLALVLELEASVVENQGAHQEKTLQLAKELIEVIKIGFEIDWHGELGVSLVLGQLLAWMAILDYFEDASRTLRWAYLDQLNTSKLITDGLIPMIFAILGVSEVGAWNFPASVYAVDEFYTEFLDSEDLPDLAPLASYLFYRALVTIPSSFRSYYESLKDRQLSMSMLSFTARHYSPVIIAHEFSALRQPAAMTQLTEEGLNIRIVQGGGATIAANSVGSAEAIASYVVDEQPMEIGIRLPAEFPLKGVDVRDLRRVGVPENKWRGWLMSVQQTITSRNGLIMEALTVFKKNVSLHFEGVVECAICYSIISVTDRTLPTKPLVQLISFK
ncbi:hypothetical protein L204_101086 [Cryptococcus depauperatus]